MDEEESTLSNTDLEEEDVLEMSSGEKAMRDFLDELKKYRKKFKKKAKEAKQLKSLKSSKKSNSNPNPSQSPNSVEISEMKKKKRKRHKLFDPHPPPKDTPKNDINENEPKKVLTRKEYKSLMERLMKKKDDKGEKKQNQSSPTKDKNQPKNSQIFNDLYNKSIEAEQKRKEMKEAQNKNEEENLKIWAQPKTCRQSKVYAHNRMVQYINNAFQKNKIYSEERLLDILLMLGLAENKRMKQKSLEFSDPDKNSFYDEEEESSEMLEKKKHASHEKSKSGENETQNLKNVFAQGNVCKTDTLFDILQKLDYIRITKEIEPVSESTDEPSDSQKENIESESDNGTMYDISNLKNFYLEVAKDQISTQFHAIAKEKLLIAMANEKKQPKFDYDFNKQFTTAPTLTRKTLDRLVPPKSQKPQEETNETANNNNININNKEEYEPIKLSEGSKKILDESTRKADDDKLLCSLPIEEREKHLLKVKNDKIEQMKLEFQSQLTQGKIHSNPMPIYDEKTTEMLEKYKEEKKNRVEEEPTYRPNITKYEDYKKMQDELNSSEVKNPQGWDKDISRHRKAYDNFIHLKRLKEEGIDYLLECRINARAQLRETNQIQNSANIKSPNKGQNQDLSQTKYNKTYNLPQKECVPPMEKANKKFNQDVQNERVRFNFSNNESDDADIED